MSDALSYLMSVRPDAMKSYFGFLKASGEHLDPKTRAIISVITKVDNQTEAGFRQYLPKALQAGATPDEILDALLCAFPTLGLTKIIWAVNILLEMDIPEFRAEHLGQATGWCDIADIDEIIEGRTVFVEVDGHGCFIHRSGDDIRVYDNRCPHRATVMTGGDLDGDTLTCPGHGWRFDTRTGDCVASGDRPLRRYDHKVEKGRLWIYR